MRILIICTGNSCRSQMAHGFLQSFDDRLEVFSAGLKPEERVNLMAVRVMAEAGINLTGHKPESLSTFSEQEWDYVITVCDNANEECPVFTGKVNHRLHIGFDDPSKAVGTPQFIGMEFYRIRDEIERNFYDFYLSKLKPQLK